MANPNNGDRSITHRSVTDRGSSRRYKTAQNHLNAQEHYRNRAQGRINKAPKGPFLNDKIPKG